MESGAGLPSTGDGHKSDILGYASHTPRKRRADRLYRAIEATLRLPPNDCADVRRRYWAEPD
jgi:hypothetical protein